MPTLFCSRYHSTDPSFLIAWQPQTTLLKALLVGFLEEEEDVPEANCCVFLGRGGQLRSVGYIPFV